MIDDLHDNRFLQKHLNFGKNADLSTDKLMVGGHSFGGMTALAVAEADPRVKLVFTFDPWLYARKDEILNKTFII